MNPTYLATARLMAEIAPAVFESGLFQLQIVAVARPCKSHFLSH